MIRPVVVSPASPPAVVVTVSSAELASLRELASRHPLAPRVELVEGLLHLVDSEGRTLLGDGGTPLRYATADGCACALLEGVRREAERARRAHAEAEAYRAHAGRLEAEAMQIVSRQGRWF